jgi:hypothetical protein
MFSGLMALDDSMGPMCPGDLICLVGRPCSLKSLLLLHIALNVRASALTNVLFITFREPPACIGQLAPMPDQRFLMYRDLTNVLKGCVSPESDASCHVWMVGASPGDMPTIAAAVRGLQTVHSAGCGLVILDGWGCGAGRRILFGSNRPSDLDACVPELPGDEAPARVSEADIAAAKALAGTAGVPVLMGVRSARTPKTRFGPKPHDLAHVREVLPAYATQTVWMHRPAVLWFHAGKRLHLDGIVRVVGERDRFDGAWPTRSLLHYDFETRQFTSALTWWGRPPRAQCYPPELAHGLQDDLRDWEYESIDQARGARRKRRARIESSEP